MRKQRTFNKWVASYGVPNTGKTEKAIANILDTQRMEQCYVIAHDLGFAIPDRLHDGRQTHVQRHDSVGEARIALLKSPGGIHAISEMDADLVVAFAREVARKSLEEHSTPQEIKEGRGRGVPVILFIDEIVQAKAASNYRIGNDLKILVAKRRHENVGFVFTAQSPHLCHYLLGTLSTDVYIFNLIDEEDIKFLIKRMSVPKEIAMKASKLSIDKHQFIHYSPGNGLLLI